MFRWFPERLRHPSARGQVSLLRFQLPPPRTGHAVLPHPAHRRRSPPAFGLIRQSLKGLGGTTIPDMLIRPRSLTR